jgi:3-oxoacyl-[acyl-carrier protein] reductase
MGWTLVTGSSKGLGRAIALRLAEEGHSLIIHYHHSAELANQTLEKCLAKGVEAKLVQGDFSTQDSVTRFLDKLENVEHLVNNVGHFHIQPGSKTAMETWQSLYQVNFFAPLSLIQGCLPSIKQHRGSILNIGSVGVGVCRADAKFTAYTASKMSLHFLTKSLAKELAPTGVRVNMVSPGEMENSVSKPADPSKLPMGRVATLKETAEAAAFLLKPENHYITGQNIEVGGALAL